MSTQNEKQASDKILERIRALLAMGSDVSSQNEAAIALKRARSLMDEHQVTLADIEDIQNDDLGVKNYDTGSTRQEKWVTLLAVAVASLNDCIVGFADRKNRYDNKQYEFKGFTEDASMCDFMLVYLVDTCNRLYKRDKVKASLVGAGDKNDYLLSLSRVLIKRMKEMTDQRREAVASDSRSLVVVKMAMVENQFGKANYRNSKAKKIRDENAGHAGRRAAKEVHLGSFVGNQNKSKASIAK